MQELSNIKVEPVPGCCALIAAITSSGLPSDRFSFHGFLPRSASKRINELKKISDKEETLIFYESVHRIQSAIEDMITVFEAIGLRCFAKRSPRFMNHL